MRRFPTVSDRGPGFEFFAMFAVLVIWLATLALPASAASKPERVLSGLAAPAETVTTATGDLYFIQLVSSDTVTLSRLALGESTPSVVYSLIGTKPYLNDIHFDPAGKLIFTTSVATNADGTTRRWDLTRLDPATGVATVLTTTNGVPIPASDPAFVCTGPLCGLQSGTEIDLNGVSGSGTIYFSEHSDDPTAKTQTADLLALDPGSSTPREVEHFAGPSGNDLIRTLVVAKTGEVYFSENINLYQFATTGLRILVASVGVRPAANTLHSGLDSSGNLYVLERDLTGFVRFGCATSTTMRIVSFSAQDLASPGPSPTPGTVSEATYDGFVAGWLGSSSFFRVSPTGDVYWYQTRVDCATGLITNDVFRIGHGQQQQQTLLYEETGPDMFSTSGGNAFAAGPIGLAPVGGALYIASIKTGEIYRDGSVQSPVKPLVKVVCFKGKQHRAFIGKCPNGWKKKT